MYLQEDLQLTESNEESPGRELPGPHGMAVTSLGLCWVLAGHSWLRPWGQSKMGASL